LTWLALKLILIGDRLALNLFIALSAQLFKCAVGHGEDLFKWATPRRFQLASQHFQSANVHHNSCTLQFVASAGVERNI
jgi:hypothetical protein